MFCIRSDHEVQKGAPMQTTLLFAAPDPGVERPRTPRSGRAATDGVRAEVTSAQQGQFTLAFDVQQPSQTPHETRAGPLSAQHQPSVTALPPPPTPTGRAVTGTAIDRPAAAPPVTRKMPTNSRFIVQAFRTGPRGALVAESAIVATTAAGACLRAERMAPGKAGVVAYAVAGDSESGDYPEPVVLARFGDAPEEMQ